MPNMGPICPTNRPHRNEIQPRNPAPASSITVSKSERHHAKCLGMVGTPTRSQGREHPARSSNAPTARPPGRQRSEASSQMSSPEAQRGSGTATRPAATLAAPQHCRRTHNHNLNTDVDPHRGVPMKPTLATAAIVTASACAPRPRSLHVRGASQSGTVARGG